MPVKTVVWAVPSLGLLLTACLVERVVGFSPHCLTLTQIHILLGCLIPFGEGPKCFVCSWLSPVSLPEFKSTFF